MLALGVAAGHGFQSLRRPARLAVEGPRPRERARIGCVRRGCHPRGRRCRSARYGRPACGCRCRRGTRVRIVGRGCSLALHAGVTAGLDDDKRFSDLGRGEAVGAIALSSDDVPIEEGGRLSGRAAWVAPLTPLGIAVLGARGGNGLVAAAVMLNAPGVSQEPVDTAALAGVVCGHLRLDGAPFVQVGATMPFMSRVRILLAAAGLGMGRRALREALAAAHGHTGHGAGGEQTVQGLLADAATELDAAMLLTWKAATAGESAHWPMRRWRSWPRPRRHRARWLERRRSSEQTLSGAVT